MKGREKPALIARRSFARAGCGRASRRPGRSRSRSRLPAGTRSPPGRRGGRRRRGRRSRRAACRARPSPTSSSSSRSSWKDLPKEAQWSKSTARRSFSAARAASLPQAPSQTRSLQASRWWKPGESSKGTVVASSRWSKSPLACSTIHSHSSSSTIERSPSLEHPAGARVDEDHPRPAEVAAEAPAAAGAGRVRPRRRTRAARWSRGRCRGPARRGRLRRAPAARGCRGAGRPSSS